jgi:hypothetical protein
MAVLYSVTARASAMAMQIWSLKQPRGGGGVAWPTAEAPVIADITIVEVCREQISLVD